MTPKLIGSLVPKMLSPDYERCPLCTRPVLYTSLDYHMRLCSPKNTTVAGGESVKREVAAK